MFLHDALTLIELSNWLGLDWSGRVVLIGVCLLVAYGLSLSFKKTSGGGDA